MAGNASLIQLQTIICYCFKNVETVGIALKHPGLQQGTRENSREFERLEFLGDRVLGLAVASVLYEKFPEDREGDLAVRMAALVGTDFLISLVKRTRLLDCFSIPRDFFVSIHKNSAALADMLEAVFGAIFLDANFETVREIVGRLWEKDVNNVVHRTKDFKSQLQEMTQARSSGLPVYRLLKISGEAHDPIFEIEVTASKESAIGYGNSKKSAEHDAASKLLQKFRVIS
ncbi:MAG: ribonuclease III [Holosporaceae bacterium]|jgi:ribonuclease-3|nr:ribonuclease III [Holosporaceae bacterium]